MLKEHFASVGKKFVCKIPASGDHHDFLQK